MIVDNHASQTAGLLMFTPNRQVFPGKLPSGRSGRGRRHDAQPQSAIRKHRRGRSGGLTSAECRLLFRSDAMAGIVLTMPYVEMGQA